MEEDIQFELTSDGSHTLYIPSLDEHYHSVNGAIQESLHVFVKTGLQHCDKDSVNLLEIGFGTGLNAFLTYLNAQDKHIDYTGIELYPLGTEIINKLNYTEKENTAQQKIYKDLHSAEWNKEVKISPGFSLTKREADFSLLDINFGKTFDLIYFDAFAPDKQPEMWTQDIFDFLYEITNPGGILTTYCAKGIVRRIMQHSGYTVERLPGPPGKREILRAVKAL